MNACESTDSRAIRVLSPRIDPPERGVDGEDGDPRPGRGQGHAQLVDEGRLAHPGHAADPHPPGAAGVRQQLDQQLLRPLAVVAAVGLDERDRPRHGPSVPGQHPLGQRGDVDLPPSHHQ
jgi:hypothetical protein